MALDIYCGTLCRYYLGDWQTVIQRWAEENGIDYVVNRKKAEGMDTTELTEEESKALILKWKQSLQHFLEEQQQVTFAWNESDDAPYRSDRPDWSAYWLVLLWALYQEQGETPFDEVPAGFQLDQDRVFERRTMPGYQCQYPMLNSEAELFLPIPAPVQISGGDPFGQPVTVASSVELLNELQLLNERTWQASDEEIASWRSQYNRIIPAMNDGQLTIGKTKAVDRFEEVAKYGFSIFYDLATFAVANHLPMRLDW